MSTDNLQNLDLNLLPGLVALLEERHVTNAASRMNRTQSAMSHTLRKLREVFDDELLVRSGNEMLRTPLADALLPEVRRTLGNLSSLMQPRTPVEPTRIERRFHIAASDMTEFVVLDRLLPSLATTAPGVQLHTTYVEHRVGESIEQRLRDGAFDLALTVMGEDVTGILAQRLYTERLVCVVGRGNALARKDAELTLERYVGARHVLVSPRGRPGGFVDDTLARAGLERKVVWMTMNFLSAAILTSSSDDLILTLPSRVATILTRNGVDLHVVDAPLTLPGFSVVVAYHERFRDDPTHRWFRDHVIEVARDA